MAEFKSPVVHVNAGGWGPTEDNVPEQFRDLPFAPFGKGDLGKGFRVADFTANGAAQQRFQNRFRGKDEPVNTEYAISLRGCSPRRSTPH
jgi:translation initiation factor 3 subunit D